MNLETHPAAKEVEVVAAKEDSVSISNASKQADMIDTNDLADRLDSLLDKPQNS